MKNNGKRINSDTNYKIIALAGSGKPMRECAELVGVSRTYCTKLVAVTKLIGDGDWSSLIKYPSGYSLRNVVEWACEFHGVELPAEVAQALQEREKATETISAPTQTADTTTAANEELAIVKLMEQLDKLSELISTNADDICQTAVTDRKLIIECINNNFDVLNATIRDGFESVKTTLRKTLKGANNG